MNKIPAISVWAVFFGLCLGLGILKFGNPVVLDHKIATPSTLEDFLNDPWPLRWANWILVTMGGVGIAFVFRGQLFLNRSKGLLFWPLVWLGWQFVSALHTVDEALSTATLWQFSGCVACYFLGALLMAHFSGAASQELRLKLLLLGVLVAFVICLVRAVNQHYFELPSSYKALKEGERCGWTNFAPEALAEMRQEGLVVATNGLNVANPIILDKLRKGRVSGTMVYPNALASLILLFFPASLMLVFCSMRRMRPTIIIVALTLLFFLGCVSFYWTGSKLGWIVGMGMAGLYFLKLETPRKFKIGILSIVTILGAVIFIGRFHGYFSSGATSATARLDYWQAAAKIAEANPIFGTGPGTFQRSYALIKSPTSEMARLAHNDYLQQFSDSGILGGLAYCGWIGLLISFAWRQSKYFKPNSLWFAVFVGIIGWLAQGIGEFGLYIPATSWIAFTLLGCLIWAEAKKFDKIRANS